MTPRAPEFVEPEPARRVAQALAGNWVPNAQVTFIRAFSNSVYLLSSNAQRLYLRITSSEHRSEAQLTSELQFIRFLAGRGVPVSEPVPSRTGRLVDGIEQEGATFYASAFLEAPGQEFEALSPSAKQESLRLAGRTMGQLHREGAGFDRPNGFRRFPWLEDRWTRFPILIPRREREAWQLYEEIRKWTNDLPRDPSVYGMIHGDFTILNMRVLPSRITLFDFDSCCEHWYGYEIATFLHYFGGQDAETRKRTYENLLDGYAQAIPLDKRTLASIPLFGKMRLLYSFLVFAEQWGFEGLTLEQEKYFALRRRLFVQKSAWPPEGTGPTLE